jgi:hypothetical protein
MAFSGITLLMRVAHAITSTIPIDTVIHFLCMKTIAIKQQTCKNGWVCMPLIKIEYCFTGRCSSLHRTDGKVQL